MNMRKMPKYIPLLLIPGVILLITSIFIWNNLSAQDRGRVDNLAYANNSTKPHYKISTREQAIALADTLGYKSISPVFVIFWKEHSENPLQMSFPSKRRQILLYEYLQKDEPEKRLLFFVTYFLSKNETKTIIINMETGEIEGEFDNGTIDRSKLGIQ